MDLASTWGSIFRVFVDATIEIVPFFLLAVLLGALLEEFVSERTIGRFLTGRQPGTMLLAFVTAGATVSIPVLLLTWKILGAEWMLVRLLASVVFGLLVGYAGIGVLRGVAAGSPPGPPAE